MITVIYTSVEHVQRNQTQLTAEHLMKSVRLINSTLLPMYGMSSIGVGNLTVWSPGGVITAVHPLVPMVWASDGSLGIRTNESITMLRGLGLRLGPGQDAAKVRTCLVCMCLIYEY